MIALDLDDTPSAASVRQRIYASAVVCVRAEMMVMMMMMARRRRRRGDNDDFGKFDLLA